MAESNDNTLIAADTKVKGDMVFERTATIRGRFDGKISAKGELHVAQSGRCKAEIEANNVKVDGKIEGNVSASQKVHINANAQVKGDIVTEKLLTEEGASIQGHLTVGPDAARAAQASPPNVQVRSTEVPSPSKK